VIDDGTANPIGLCEAERELMQGTILCDETGVLGEITVGLDAHPYLMDLVAERELERSRGLFGLLVHSAVPLPNETVYLPEQPARFPARAHHVKFPSAIDDVWSP
jgi:hypothetical protein